MPNQRHVEALFDNTQTIPKKLASFFPRNDSPPPTDTPSSGPQRPTTVGPVFDPELTCQPIPAFNNFASWEAFPEIAHGALPPPNFHGVPPKPAAFSAAYLSPMLARNERERLTLLWYYTRTLFKDTEILSRLQDKVNFVKEFIGWEFAIMGILDNDVYTRVAVSGASLAILPRRESTCAHTINYASKSVLQLPEMGKDWRFQHSPHVETGGIRSYAGTQMLCKTTTGGEVALGSVCVASNTAGQLLTQTQQTALIRFAEMLSDELVNRVRLSRSFARKIMTDVIANIHQQAEAPKIQEIVVDAVRKIYPDCRVTLQTSQDGKIQLTNRDAIYYSEPDEGLWEDSAYIENAITTSNHAKLTSVQTVRAIIWKCTTHPEISLLVVDTTDMHYVFDDVDSWFVERCALTLCNILQKRMLAEALQAKDTFLRGITHQLRTPIHGVLAMVEVLADELDNIDGDVTRSEGSFQEKAAEILQSINSSGKELMITVNYILRLNKWAEIAGGVQRPGPVDLNLLEKQIYDEVMQLIAPEERPDTFIFFLSQLPREMRLLWIDQSLLRECLHAMILNAFQSTTGGGISIITSVTEDFSLIHFDVSDSGWDVDPADWEEVSDSYEKGQASERGLGVGLTLASKVAALLGGSLSVVSAVKGKGSHNRLELHRPVFACPIHPPHAPQLLETTMPRKVYAICETEDSPVLVLHFTHYLEIHGFTRSNKPEDAIQVLCYRELEEYENLLRLASPHQALVCLIPTKVKLKMLRHITLPENALVFTGPFSSYRLDEILQGISTYYRKMSNRSATLSSSRIPPDSNPPVSPSSAIGERFTRNGFRLHALLVDDNSVNLRIMRMYCEKRKIPYCAAEDGLEAFQHYESASSTSNPVNIVFMDLQMPKCDGAEASDKIRQLESRMGLERSVIIMVTGQDSASDKKRAFECGADEYLVKPVGLKELDGMVSRYFRGFVGQ